MAILTINTGTGANKGDGDSIRTAFNKINYNFRTLENVYIASGVASFNGQGGQVTFTATDIISQLGFLPYANSNPAGYISSANLANYVTLPYLNNQDYVSNTVLDSKNYAPISYVTGALQNYATQLYVNSQGFVARGELTGFGFITRTDLLGYEYQTSVGVDTIVRNNLAGYVTTSSLGLYATQNYVQTYVATVSLSVDKISSTNGQLKIYSDGKLEVIGAVSLVNAITSSTILTASSDNRLLTLGTMSSWQTDLAHYAVGTEPNPLLTVLTTSTNWKFDGNDASLNIPTIWTRWRSNPGSLTIPYEPPSSALVLPSSKGIDTGYPRIIGIDHTNTQFISIINSDLYYNPSNPVETYYSGKTWKYGKSANLNVDTARTDRVSIYSQSNSTLVGTVTTTTVGFNYLDISQGGIALEAHTGEIFLRTNRSNHDRNLSGTGVYDNGNPLIVNEVFEYKFNPDFMTFPFGTVVSDGYSPYGFNNGVVWGGNGPGGRSNGGRGEYQFRLDIAKESSLVIKTTNTAGTTSTWSFNTAGILTLPVGGDIRNSSGASVLGGGGTTSTVTTGDWTWPSLNGGFTRALLGGSQNSYIEGQSPGGLILYNDSAVTVYANTTATWAFSLDGSLTFPTGAIITSDVGIDLIQGAAGNQLILDSSDSISIVTNDTQGVPSQTWTFGTDGGLTFPILTIATLPSAAIAGQRAFISDAVSSPTWGATVSSTGTNTYPVWSDGSIWKYG